MLTRKYSNAFIALVCQLTICATPAIACAADVVVGVNMVSPARLGAEEQDSMLTAMKAAGVRVIRAGIAPGEKGIDFVRRVYAHGIRLVWVLEFGGFQPGAPTRPYQPELFPGIWAGHPLSSADPDQFRTYFSTMLGKLEAAGITLEAFELGNEINMAAFNPDFPVPGEGKQFGLDDLYREPKAQQIAKGFLQYLELLTVLKDIRDHSNLNRQTPILTAGLGAYEAPEGPMVNNTNKIDLVSVNATIDFMRAHGLDQLVDAYAIHVYPWDNGPGQGAAATSRRARLARFVLAKCQPAGSFDGKPCWITEWGFSNKDLACPIDDTDRTSLTREMMGNFRPYVKQGRLVGLFSFAWNTNPWATQPDPLSLYRCGALTESGRLALDAALLLGNPK